MYNGLHYSFCINRNRRVLMKELEKAKIRQNDCRADASSILSSKNGACFVKQTPFLLDRNSRVVRSGEQGHRRLLNRTDESLLLALAEYCFGQLRVAQAVEVTAVRQQYRLVRV